jgi:hypothetical protein
MPGASAALDLIQRHAAALLLVLLQLTPQMPPYNRFDASLLMLLLLL